MNDETLEADFLSIFYADLTDKQEEQDRLKE